MWCNCEGVVRSVQEEPKVEITDPAIFPQTKARVKLRGTPGSRDLDPSWKGVSPAFGLDPARESDVLRLGHQGLWPELAGDYNSGVTIVSDGKYSKEMIATKIRWFVVVREGRDCCSCPPIQTYNGQGVAKAGVRKNDHAILYSDGTELIPAPGERPKRQEEAMRNPIKVIVAARKTKLDSMSRINFGKIYTVEHNVKVFDFGDVHPDSQMWLLHQWQAVMGLNFAFPWAKTADQLSGPSLFYEAAQQRQAAESRPSAAQLTADVEGNEEENEEEDEENDDDEEDEGDDDEDNEDDMDDD
ncbi:hypothetical protein BJ546DRAFT_1050302 [Cryomyces antarcticus]